MIPRRVARRTARRTTRRVSRRQNMAEPEYQENIKEEPISSTEELEKLFQLKQQGAITEEEYEERKKKIL